jgi:hypothetical protein
VDFKYEFVGMTKRYAKYEPLPDQGITGSFYLATEQYEAQGKPEALVLTLSI